MTHRQRGFSLIELMVALVIGLIVSLAVFATINGFEGRKRTTSSLNDIDQVGSYALYALDKWVRSAGSGFMQGDGSPVGCQLTAARNGSQILPRTSALPAPFATVSTGTALVFKLVPLLIIPDGTTPNVSGASSDALLIMNGNAGAGEVSATFNAAATASQITLRATQGFNGGDQILLADLSTASAGKPCLITEVTSAFSGGATTTLPIAANTSNSSYYYASTVNGNAITGYTDTSNDVVFNLGNAAKGSPANILLIGVGDNNTLFGFDLLHNLNPTSNGIQSAFPVADGVFELHARYGIDSDDDGKVDAWVKATGDYTPANLTAGTSSALKNILRIKAVRIGLMLRTGLLEKDAVAGDSLTLFADLGDTLIATRNLTANERHYRYRTLETIIPLRNNALVSTE